MEIAQIVARYLRQKGYYYTLFGGERSMIQINFGVYGSDEKLEECIIFSEDGPDVQIEVRELFTLTKKEKEAACYYLCNQYNNEYRWVKFIYHDGVVTAKLDSMLQGEECGEQCLRLLITMAKVCEMVYPGLAQLNN